MSVKRTPPAGGRLARTPSVAVDALEGDADLIAGCSSEHMTPARVRAISDSVMDVRRGAKRPPSSPLENTGNKRSMWMSDEDIWALKEELATQDDNFAQANATSKDSAAKKHEMCQIIAAYRRAVDRLVMAYTQVKAEREATVKMWDLIKEQVIGMPGSCGGAPVLGSMTPQRSYAGVVRTSEAVQRGPPYAMGERNVGPRERGVHLETLEVMPSREEERKFPDSAATCRAVYAAVNPGELGIKVNRVIKGRSKTVRIVAEKEELEKIKPALESAGLTMRQSERLNPRLVVRDIPADTDKDQFVKELAQQNLKAKSADNIKVVYWFPKKDARTSSVVIEVPPEVRRELMERGRVYVGWSACRISDHLRIVQCYRCLSFGHIAKDCKATRGVCGHCAGEHEMRSCPDRSVRSCRNCVTAGMQQTDHSAVDTDSCPILRRRLEDKARRINYEV